MMSCYKRGKFYFPLLDIVGSVSQFKGAISEVIGDVKITFGTLGTIEHFKEGIDHFRILILPCRSLDVILKPGLNKSV